MMGPLETPEKECADMLGTGMKVLDIRFSGETLVQRVSARRVSDGPKGAKTGLIL